MNFQLILDTNEEEICNEEGGRLGLNCTTNQLIFLHFEDEMRPLLGVSLFRFISLSEDGTFKLLNKENGGILEHRGVPPSVKLAIENDQPNQTLSLTSVGETGDGVEANVEKLKNEKQKFDWNAEATKNFFEAYKKVKLLNLKKKFGTRKKFFEAVAVELQKVNITVDWEQVQSKYKSLQRLYIKVTRNNNTTGRAPQSMDYEDEMNELFGPEHNINPVVLYDSTTGFQTSQGYSNPMSTTEMTESNDEDDPDDPTSESSSSTGATVKKPQRKKPKLNKTASVLADCQESLKKFMDATEKRREERAAFEKRYVELQEKEVKSADDFRKEFLAILSKQNN